MPSPTELVAHNRTTEEIAEVIGADKLIYQDIDDLIQSVSVGNPSIRTFDTSCFTGIYATGDITPEYLASIDSARNDDAQTTQKPQGQETVGIYNGA